MLKLLAELVGVALIVAGLGLWSVPLALVAAGFFTVAAIEVRG